MLPHTLLFFCFSLSDLHDSLWHVSPQLYWSLFIPSLLSIPSFSLVSLKCFMLLILSASFCPPFPLFICFPLHFHLPPLFLSSYTPLFSLTFFSLTLHLLVSYQPLLLFHLPPSFLSFFQFSCAVNVRYDLELWCLDSFFHPQVNGNALIAHPVLLAVWNPHILAKGSNANLGNKILQNLNQTIWTNLSMPLSYWLIFYLFIHPELLWPPPICPQSQHSAHGLD